MKLKDKLRKRSAFTLIELLVAMSLVAMVSAMLTTGMRGAIRQAREKRARGEFINYTQLILARYNSIAFGGLNINQAPIRRPSRVSGLGTTTESGIALADNEIQSLDTSRMRMLARRDFARMVLPECQADLFYPPATLQYRMNLGSNSGQMSPSCAQVSPPPAWDQMRSLLGLRTGEGINDYLRLLKARRIPTGLLEDQQNPATNPQFDCIEGLRQNTVFRKACTHGVSTADPDSLIPITWSREYESAECLYLILATYRLAGGVAIDNVPERNIGDLDNDGVPEILDPWGRPVVFMRSPVGLKGRGVDAQFGDADPFDFLATDHRYRLSVNQYPVYLSPVVVSAGQDGEFGLVTPETIPDIFYSSSATYLSVSPQPQRLSSYAQNGAGPMTHRYPDPFYNVKSLVKDPEFGAATSLTDLPDQSVSGGPQPNRVLDSSTFGGIQIAKQAGGMGAFINVDFAADNVTSLDSDL